MPQKRRTEIQIETHELTIIRGGKAREDVYCERCQCWFELLTLQRTAEHLSMCGDRPDERLERGIRAELLTREVEDSNEINNNK